MVDVRLADGRAEPGRDGLGGARRTTAGGAGLRHPAGQGPAAPGAPYADAGGASRADRDHSRAFLGRGWVAAGGPVDAASWLLLVLLVLLMVRGRCRAGEGCRPAAADRVPIFPRCRGCTPSAGGQARLDWPELGAHRARHLPQHGVAGLKRRASGGAHPLPPLQLPGRLQHVEPLDPPRLLGRRSPHEPRWSRALVLTSTRGW